MRSEGHLRLRVTQGTLIGSRAILGPFRAPPGQSDTSALYHTLTYHTLGGTQAPLPVRGRDQGLPLTGPYYYLAFTLLPLPQGVTTWIRHGAWKTVGLISNSRH